MQINCTRLHLNFRLLPRCAQTSILNPQPLACEVEFSLALTTPPAKENKPTAALVTDTYYVGEEWSSAHPTGLWLNMSIPRDALRNLIDSPTSLGFQKLNFPEQGSEDTHITFLFGQMY